MKNKSRLLAYADSDAKAVCRTQKETAQCLIKKQQNLSIHTYLKELNQTSVKH